MTCQDAIALLGDYLETALGAETLADLERHLADCAPCVAYLNTFKATGAAVAGTERVEMPAEMRERLRSYLLARLR